MKKVGILFMVAVIVLITVRCSDSERHLEIEESIDSPLVPDSILPNDVVTPGSSVPDSRKYIYLTIDDSPLNGSEYIDSIISSEKIKACLFMVGKGIDESGKFRKYYKKLSNNPYIQIYNHSYSHANNKYENYYKNPESVLEDFEKNQSEFNISNKIARLPGRNLWNLGKRKKNYRQTGSDASDLLLENGYKVFGWDIEWEYDAKDYTPKESIDEMVKAIEDMVSRAKTFTPNHVILLLHDQMFGKVNDKNDLAQLIERLKENDYTFEYLSEYPLEPNL